MAHPRDPGYLVIIKWKDTDGNACDWRYFMRKEDVIDDDDAMLQARARFDAESANVCREVNDTQCVETGIFEG